MKYKRIDLSTWPRAGIFKHFTTEDQCSILLTCDVDVTEFVKRCKEHKLKFYTAFICLLSKVVNSNENFRVGYNEDGELVMFNALNPMFTDFVPETESFSSLKTEYDPDMKILYERITEVREQYKGKVTLMPDNKYENKFNITSFPWVHYKQVDLIAPTRQDVLYPDIVFGKYEDVNGKLMLPLTVKINHAVCDGYHISKFYSEISALMSSVIDEIISV